MSAYFCRLCDSNNGWTQPSNHAVEKANSHHARWGFAYEEWNFNPKLIRDGHQHGWLQGFSKPSVPRGKHDVALYVRRNGSALLVGRIWDCENISGSDLRMRYPAALAQDLAKLPRLSVTVDGNYWNLRRDDSKSDIPVREKAEPLTNIRFDPGSCALFETPVKLDFRYTRYGALCVDRCRSEIDQAARQTMWRRLFPDRVRF